MILGRTCSRRCIFCAVDKGIIGGYDHLENTQQIIRVIKALGLEYVVVTSVTRDDMPDGGASYFAHTVHEIRALSQGVNVEALIPDFGGDQKSLRTVIAAGPVVIGHNLETVRRLHPQIKPDSDYDLSLGVLRTIKYMQPRIVTKSSLLLGLGETDCDIIQALEDLKAVGCDILVMGQYLAPSEAHYPVQAYIQPARFAAYKAIAEGLGLRCVLSAPHARSSYRAGELFARVRHQQERGVVCMTSL
jgi:lipoic acid synthetase